MKGTTKFREMVRETMSPEAQRRAHELAQQDLAEMELGELRESLQLTQQELADKMNVTQVAISRLESRADLKLSTLRQLASAMGGKLRILMVTPKATVELSHLGKAKRQRHQFRKQPTRTRGEAHA